MQSISVSSLPDVGGKVLLNFCHLLVRIASVLALAIPINRSRPLDCMKDSISLLKSSRAAVEFKSVRRIVATTLNPIW